MAQRTLRHARASDATDCCGSRPRRRRDGSGCLATSASTRSGRAWPGSSGAFGANVRLRDGAHVCVCGRVHTDVRPVCVCARHRRSVGRPIGRSVGHAHPAPRIAQRRTRRSVVGASDDGAENACVDARGARARARPAAATRRHLLSAVISTPITVMRKAAQRISRFRRPRISAGRQRQRRRRCRGRRWRTLRSRTPHRGTQGCPKVHRSGRGRW